MKVLEKGVPYPIKLHFPPLLSRLSIQAECRSEESRCPEMQDTVMNLQFCTRGQMNLNHPPPPSGLSTNCRWSDFTTGFWQKTYRM